MRIVLGIAMAILTLVLASQPTPALQAGDDVSPLESIHVIDAQTGWAATARCGPCPLHVASGLTLRTTNSGTQWEDVTPLRPSGHKIEVWRMTVFSSLLAWVVPADSRGTSAEVFRTSDGGRTWKSITIPPASVTSISFINPREGWFLVSLGAAAGSEAVDIYRSADGGETWIKVASALPGSPNSGLPFGGDKSSITFLNPTSGWITGVIGSPDSLYLYVTRDGGRTWRKQNLPLPPQAQQNQPLPTHVSPRWQAWPWPPRFFTTQDGIMRVDYRHSLFNDSTGDEQETKTIIVFYITHDSGKTWANTAPVPAGQFADLRRQPSNFVDMHRGWVKEEDTLYVTNDGGYRWTKIRPNQLFADVTQLEFISPLIGWAVRNTDPYGGSGRQTFPFLLKTLDGGITWTPVTYTISRQ